MTKRQWAHFFFSWLYLKSSGECSEVSKCFVSTIFKGSFFVSYLYLSFHSWYSALKGLKGIELTKSIN